MNHKSFSEKIGEILAWPLLLGLLYFAFLAVRYIYRLILEFNPGIFQAVDPNILSALIAGAVTLAALFANQYLSKRKEIDYLMWEKKEKVYAEFIEGFFDFFIEGDPSLKDEIMKQINYKFTKNVMLIGSKKVLKSFFNLKEAAKRNPNDDGLVLLHVEKVIYAMRKDMGNRLKLEQGGILSLMFDDTHSEIKKLIGNS